MLWTLLALLGWEKEVPLLFGAIFFYSMSLFVAWSLCHGSKLLLAPQYVEYVQVFAKAMAWCSFPLGHSQLRSYNGEIAYFLVAVPLCTISKFLLPKLEANPVGELMFYLKGQVSKEKFATKFIIQMLAGFAAFYLGLAIFHFDLNPYFTEKVDEYHKGICGAGLSTFVYLGFLAEMAGVFADLVFCSFTLADDHLLDSFVKSCASCAIVSSGFHLTTMNLNPATASGLSLLCGEVDVTSHLFVYWAGPFLGTYLAFQLLTILSKKTRARTEQTRQGPQMINS